jgi:ATP-dependent exoDNAse (exonuclease V) beta subunit
MKFLIYKASAGSGKTYTLVKEYLKMALQEDDPYRFRRILAITFTNKAAAEMKERVIHVLHDIAASNGPVKEANKSLLDTISEELNVPILKLKIRAEKTLSAILHQYSDFSIGTIDSFMHRVVRTFAHDLHLPVNFSVELDQEVILRQAIEQVMDLVGDDEAITRALIGFTESRTDDEKTMSLHDDLYESASDLLKEQKAQIINKLNHLSVSDFLDIRLKLRNNCEQTELQFKEKGKLALRIIAEGGLEINDFYYGSTGIGKYFEKVANMEPGANLSPNSHQTKTLFDNIWTVAKPKPDLLQRIESVQDRLGDIGRSITSLWEEKGSQYILEHQLKGTIYSIALLNEINKMIDHIRDDQFIVHISEFNRRVADIVFNEPAPFVFERLGEKYNHYLIDEFQDTSTLQWQNLLPLVQNGLSEKHTSLIVGDGKQAIYRFRGGEVEQFAQLPSPYPFNLNKIQKERYVLLEALHKHETLKVNYRSLPEIIDFNNHLYDFIQSEILPDKYKTVYDNQEQLAPDGKNGGYVQLDLIPVQETIQDREEMQLNRCLEIIRDLLSNKKYQPRDIAILTKKNQHGTLLAGHLLNKEIPVISSESLLVQNAPEVALLVAWMHILIGSNTSMNLLVVCKYLIERKKLPYSNIDELLLHERMGEKSVLKLLHISGISIQLGELRSLSLLECCFSICETFTIDIQSNTYLQFFIEAVWNSGRSSAIDIPLFLEYWEEKREKLSITLPQDANAVRIMTVHKSKGLQFPIVILPFAYGDWPKSKVDWVDDETLLPEDLIAARVRLNKELKATRLSNYVIEEEERTELDAINLLYVATTRPEDALYIISGKSGKDGSLLKGWETYLEKFGKSTQPENFAEGRCAWGDASFKNVLSDEESEEKSEEDCTQSVVHPYTISPWQKRITISRQAPKNWDLGDDNSALVMGKLVHRALAFIKTENQVDSALNQLLQEGALNHDAIPEMKRLIHSVVSHPKLNPLFKEGNNVYNERQLLLPDGKTAIPDRVTELSGSITILDYKTGLRKDEHRVQVGNYLRYLKEMEYSNYSAFLVYLGETIEVEDVIG